MPICRENLEPRLAFVEAKEGFVVRHRMLDEQRQSAAAYVRRGEDLVLIDEAGNIEAVQPPLPFEPTALDVETEILRMEREVRFRNDNDPED